ncbi:MAG TPA: YceI family protein [Opitutaceae bacterium]|nr:YceI family protein [Opitutaceae bacterium]
MVSHSIARLLFFCACTGLAVTTPFARAAAPASLAIDPASSSIDVRVTVTIDSFTAHLTKYQATVTVDPASHAIQAAALSFNWADLKTGKSERDEQMNRWQDSATYPTGQFTLTRLSTTGNSDVAEATGTLELHGRTRQLVFPVTLRRNGAIETVDGETPVDVRDFGLPVIRKFGLLKVDPVVRVRFHLQGTLPSGS